MATEIEQKFLVISSAWRAQVRSSQTIRQAYLALTDGAAIRVRIVDGASAFLTIKSARPGTTRAEFEYAVPVNDAENLFRLCIGRLIEKTRYIVPAGAALSWEVDVFEGTHEGLVMAEIELPDPDAQFEKPVWLGAEVTNDKRYYNSSLAIR